eukprot:COSAG02_NODE_32636_length_513_cov_0.765700_2_plen_56_part_01
MPPKRKAASAAEGAPAQRAVRIKTEGGAAAAAAPSPRKGKTHAHQVVAALRAAPEG